MEKCRDACEQAADVVGTIVLKNMQRRLVASIDAVQKAVCSDYASLSRKPTAHCFAACMRLDSLRSSNQGSYYVFVMTFACTMQRSLFSDVLAVASTHINLTQILVDAGNRRYELKCVARMCHHLHPYLPPATKKKASTWVLALKFKWRDV